MGIFTSEGEKRREAKRRRRRALREVENAVDKAKAKCAELRKSRDAKWREAADELAAGREEDAKRILAVVRDFDADIARYSAKLARLEALEREMDCIDADAAFGEASSVASRVMPGCEIPDAEIEVPARPSVEELFERLAAEPPQVRPPRPGRPAADTVREDGETRTAQWTATKPSAVRLDDVVGLEEAKKSIIDALVNPAKHPDIYKSLALKPGTGLLLYGPPGTGKTLFAKAVANELGLPFMDVRCDKLKGKYVGETEKNVAGMFAAARAMGECVLFLDECNAILSRRGDQKVCMVEQFLIELDGFAASNARIYVLMATNLPWMLDGAVTRSGRISESVHAGLPDEAARRRLFAMALEGAPLEAGVDIAALAAETEGFSGADIAAKGGVCHKAKTAAARRWVARRESKTGGAGSAGPKDSGRGAAAEDEAEKITMADLERAVRETTPIGVSAADMVKRNLEFSTRGA